MTMETDKDMPAIPAMSKKKAPPVFSLQRLGYGLEMIGALGNTHQFGFYRQREQQYVGPVFSYNLSKHWTAHVEPTIGLSDVSDPFRDMGNYSFLSSLCRVHAAKRHLNSELSRT
jgi:hypothetical protein